MMSVHELREGRVTRPGALRLAGAALALALVFGMAPRSATADNYDPERAGHPLRIVAYIGHPIGVALDYLIMRPAHWVGSREPWSTIFGHDTRWDRDYERRRRMRQGGSADHADLDLESLETDAPES